MRLAKWAVLWAALVVLVCVPALAQDAVVVGDGTATDGDVQIVDCSQVVNAAQGQYGNATAIGDGAVAVIANEQNITVNQVNACLGTIGDDGNNDDTDTTDDTMDDTDTTDDATATDAEDGVMVNTIPKTAVLPATGGPSLFALGAGLALVAEAAYLIRLRR
jgi:anti-sigma factor ChrR (cupin superfamily)